jgi:hypothetical protein
LLNPAAISEALYYNTSFKPQNKKIKKFKNFFLPRSTPKPASSPSPLLSSEALDYNTKFQYNTSIFKEM